MKLAEIYTLTLGILLLGEPFALHSDFSSLGTWFWFSLGIIGILIFITGKRKKSL